MSFVQSVPRTAPLRPERGIISVIEGGASEVPSNVGQSRIEILPAVEKEDGGALTPRNYQTALSLLECAARALEILYDRRDQLEASLGDISHKAESAVVAAQAKVADWQRLAAGFKSEVQELDRRLSAMQQRAELAEAQLEAARARADEAERQAADAMDLSQGLHTRIIAAFGRGSNAHKALVVVDEETPDR